MPKGIYERKRIYEGNFKERRKQANKRYRERHENELGQYEKERYIRYKKAYSQQYFQKHREFYRILNRDRYARIRKEFLEKIDKIIGSNCLLCGKTLQEIRIHFHEIHGKKHVYSKEKVKKYILDHPKDFVPLCINCHKYIHEIFRNKVNISKLVWLIEKIRED